MARQGISSFYTWQIFHAQMIIAVEQRFPDNLGRLCNLTASKIHDFDLLTNLIPTKLFFPKEVTAIATTLSQDSVVALPTETVYGLAANARSPEAVAKIFTAKQRPAENPLIVHLGNCDLLNEFAAIEHQWVWDCIERFSPGPISYVLPYRGGLAPQVTAGLPTVAIRFPNHDTFVAILRKSGLALAAPSANLSGRPSATTWQAVLADLDGRIEGIVCDEPCHWGLESTVVDATTETPIVLRPGAVSLEELRYIVPTAQRSSQTNDIQNRSPGTRFRHYQPHAKVIIVDDVDAALKQFHHEQCAVIRISDHEQIARDNALLVENCRDVSHYAQRLFEFFREADEAACSIVLCGRVPNQGIGIALMDRLQRAASSELA